MKINSLLAAGLVGSCLSSLCPQAASADFVGLCSGATCVVSLSHDGVHAEGKHISNQAVYQWRSFGSDPLTPLQRGSKTAKGAVIGGLAGAALLGPVGAAVGAIWGGSEESSGDAAPDKYFQVVGFDSSGRFVSISVQFENPDVARRFRMQLPMFTRLTSGEVRSIESIQSQYPQGVSLKMPEGGNPEN